MDRVTLSISIVSYYNFDDIEKAIKTIEQYTCHQISKKIYIVDNGNEEDKYEKLIKNYSDIEYIHSGKNLGFGGGHNYVLDKINSKYHAIVNPDILLTEDSFVKIIDFMKDEAVGLCVPKLVDENGNILQVYRRELTVMDMFIRMFCRKLFPKRFAYHTMYDADYEAPFQVPFAQGSFLVIRTELWKNLNGFDLRYFMYLEDADLCRKVNQISKVMYYPGTAVVHKWEQGSHKNLKMFKYHITSMFRYMKKWGFKFI